MPSLILPKPICWQEAEKLIQTGDLLQCRPTNLEGYEIARLTDKEVRKGRRPKWQDYSHSAMAGLDVTESGRYRRLMSGETVGHRNAHKIDLGMEIQAWPGYYDLWRPKWPVGSDPEKSWDAMASAAGTGYGYSIIWWQWKYHRLPFASYWLPRIPNSDRPDAQRVCSGLFHWTLRQGGGPQVSRYDCEVAPNDLPAISEYQFTLFATQQQVKNFLFHLENVQ